jgi:hypothetical protein
MERAMRSVITLSILAGLLLAATPDPARAYGALAIGRGPDGAPSIALVTRPNRERAARDAMAVCERMVRRRGAAREPCEIALQFQNRCYAAVTDREQRVFLGSSINENYWSRVRAQDYCRRAGGGTSCRVVRSLCDRTVGQPVQPPQGRAPASQVSPRRP